MSNSTSPHSGEAIALCNKGIDSLDKKIWWGN